ncbi:MAG: DMT family transporter [Vibrio sp.]
MTKSHSAIALFISVCLIWGTTWLAMELAVATIPPVFATGMRFLIASPLLIALCVILKQPILFPKGQRGWMPIISLFYFALPFSLMIIGEQYISSGLASILFSTMPIAVMISSRFLLGLKLKAHQYIGLLMAVVALVVILSLEMNVNARALGLGVAALLTAVAMHAIMYALVQKHCQTVPVLTYNALPCTLAALFLLIFSYLREPLAFDAFSMQSMFAVVYLGLFASVGGIVAYFKLGQVSSPFSASMCFLIFPLIALSLSHWVQGASLSEQSFWLLIPLLAGIGLTKVPSINWPVSFHQKAKGSLTSHQEECPQCHKVHPQT